MPLYVGETVRVTNRATGFDGLPLTDADVDSVTIAIYDSDGVEVLAETPMAWDALGDGGGPLWYFDWSTGGRASGPYTAKVRVIGPSGRDSFEYVTIRLRQPKV